MRDKIKLIESISDHFKKFYRKQNIFGRYYIKFWIFIFRIQTKWILFWNRLKNDHS